MSRFTYIGIPINDLPNTQSEEYHPTPSHVSSIIQKDQYYKTVVVAESLEEAKKQLANILKYPDCIYIPVKYELTETKKVKFISFYIGAKEYNLQEFTHSNEQNAVNMSSSHTKGKEVQEENELYGLITMPNYVYNEGMISKRIFLKEKDKGNYSWQTPVFATREECLRAQATLPPHPKSINIPVKYTVKDGQYYLLSFLEKGQECSLGHTPLAAPSSKLNSPTSAGEKPSTSGSVQPMEVAAPRNAKKPSFFKSITQGVNRLLSSSSSGITLENLENDKKIGLITPGSKSNN